MRECMCVSSGYYFCALNFCALSFCALGVRALVHMKIRCLIFISKLQVILRKRATNYRVLLRKMTYEDKALSFCALSVRALVQYRMAKTQRMPQTAGHSSQKSH